MLHLHPDTQPDPQDDMDSGFISLETKEIVWPEPPRWRLCVTPDWQICLAHRPGWWSRQWQRFFLGWVWEPIE